MRDKVREKQYVVTFHARKEMLDDELSANNIEFVILTGNIRERQKDRITDEWKYRVHGRTANGQPVAIVAKLSSTGKLIVITVYAL